MLTEVERLESWDNFIERHSIQEKYKICKETETNPSPFTVMKKEKKKKKNIWRVLTGKLQIRGEGMDTTY